MVRPGQLVVVAALLCIGSQARAQRKANKGIEIGMDAAFTENWASRRGSTISSTQLEAPLQVLRVGIGLSPTVSLEPALGFRSTHTNDGTFSETTFDLGLPIDFSQTTTGTQWFVRPFVGTQSQPDFHQNSLGLGIGVRVPVVTHALTRFELRYRHWLDHGLDESYSQLSLLAGFSLVGH